MPRYLFVDSFAKRNTPLWVLTSPPVGRNISLWIYAYIRCGYEIVLQYLFVGIDIAIEVCYNGGGRLGRWRSLASLLVPRIDMSCGRLTRQQVDSVV